MSVQIQKRHFNVNEYYRIAEAIFSEDDRVELIEGEILEMNAIGSRHAACVKRLVDALADQNVRRVAIVSVQDPIQLDDYSEPQPDVALLRPHPDFYAQAHPLASDVLLVVEVADSSVDYDREVKLPLYARSGIPEVWLVDLPADVIEVYARPVSGKYQVVKRAGRGEHVTSASVPSLALSVDAVLG